MRFSTSVTVVAVLTLHASGATAQRRDSRQTDHNPLAEPPFAAGPERTREQTRQKSGSAPADAGPGAEPRSRARRPSRFSAMAGYLYSRTEFYSVPVSGHSLQLGLGARYPHFAWHVAGELHRGETQHGLDVSATYLGGPVEFGVGRVRVSIDPRIYGLYVSRVTGGPDLTDGGLALRLGLAVDIVTWARLGGLALVGGMQSSTGVGSPRWDIGMQTRL